MFEFGRDNNECQTPHNDIYNENNDIYNNNISCALHSLPPGMYVIFYNIYIYSLYNEYII